LEEFVLLVFLVITPLNLAIVNGLHRFAHKLISMEYAQLALMDISLIILKIVFRLPVNPLKLMKRILIAEYRMRMELALNAANTIL
jgi:hypothetical protein